MKYLAILLISSVMLFSSAPAKAANLYVGTERDHQTIQAAVDAAENGDYIYVDDGVYQETVRVPKNLHFRLYGNTENPNNVVIKGNILFAEKTNSSPDWPIITSLMIDAKGKEYGVQSPTTIELWDVRIKNATYGVSVTGGSLLINKSIIRHSKEDGIVYQGGGSFWIRNSYIKKNRKAGLHIIGDYFGRITHSRLVKNGRGVTVENGTFLYPENEQYEGLYKSTIKENQTGILLINESTLKRSKNSFVKNGERVRTVSQ